MVVFNEKPGVTLSNPDWNLNEAQYAIGISNMCQVYHCLPRAGGLMDQDCRMVQMLSLVSAAQQEKQEIEMAKAKH